MSYNKKTQIQKTSEDYGDARADHHPYHRGSMSSTQPYNDYDKHAVQNKGSESLQSYGRGYAADNSHETGYKDQQIFGTWRSQAKFFQSSGNEGQNV